MARTSNSELLKRYRTKLSQSKRMRKQEQFDDTWKRMLDLYRGRHYENYSDEDRLLVNMAFSTINVIAPSVSVNYPKIVVSARKPEDADKATITESIVNYWWRHYDCQTQFKSAVKDFLIFGHGWIKAGYRFVEEDKVAKSSPLDESNDYIDLVPESNMETELIVTEDRPFIERISPFDVFVDPDATSVYDMRWIAQRIKRPLVDVKNDRRYNSSARSDAQPTLYSKYGDNVQAKQPYGEERDSYVEVWEWYDISTKTMAVFCDGSDKFLINPTKIPFTFGHPFVMLRNYEVPEHFYPMGELEAIESLQHELNATRTQMMNHRKRFSRKWLYRESAFDPDGRSALESDEDNIMVPVSGDEPLGNVIVPMPAVISPPEFYNQSSLISGDMDRVSGVSDYMRGAMPEIRRTATEAAIAQDASNARAAEKLALIEIHIGSCAKRLVALAQQYMTGEQVARVVGSNAIPLWINFDRDFIQGEFDFEVEGGSTQPVNESFRRQMALQLVDAMAPFVGAGVVDMASLARHVLQYGFGIKSPEAFLAAPQQQQMGPEQGGMPLEQGGMPPQGMLPQGQPQQGEQPMPQQGGIPPELAAMLGGGMPPQ
jgi:hypothetical protein